MLFRYIILHVVLGAGSQKKLKWTRCNPNYFWVLLSTVKLFGHLISHLKVFIFWWSRGGWPNIGGHFESPPDHLNCDYGAICMWGALDGQILRWIGKESSQCLLMSCQAYAHLLRCPAGAHSHRAIISEIIVRCTVHVFSPYSGTLRVPGWCWE